MDEQKTKPGANETLEEQQPKVPRPGRLSVAMDEVIEEAIRSGAFDNLPGRGKPLKLVKNPYAPGTELAYQLLKDNNYTLPWIAERQIVLARIESFRNEIGRLWRRYESEYQVAQSEMVRMSLALGWERHLASWRQQIAEINQQIMDVNLKQPGEQWAIITLSLESELTRAEAAGSLG